MNIFITTFAKYDNFFKILSKNTLAKKKILELSLDLYSRFKKVTIGIKISHLSLEMHIILAQQSFST